MKVVTSAYTELDGSQRIIVRDYPIVSFILDDFSGLAGARRGVRLDSPPVILQEMRREVIAIAAAGSSRGWGRRHTDMDVFHGDWRAPKASRPIITVVATEDAMKQLLAAFGIPSLDFAIGEPGQEEVMLQISTTNNFPFPRVVITGTRVSVRAADPAGHDVQVRVS